MNRVTDNRPWGSFIRFTHNEPSTVKLLYVKAGEAFSLQYHEHRQEFWRVISGSPDVTVGTEIHHAKPGEEFTIPPQTLHRVSAVVDDVVILEIATGMFDEDDIVRVEDKYNRGAHEKNNS